MAMKIEAGKPGDGMKYMYHCPVCGGEMSGDGYTVVSHCENVDLPLDIEPDAGPIYCELDQEI